jgi:hypothetical protein
MSAGSKMFHRGHGRPLLGAAVVIGASRSAAKHEVAKQEQRNSEMQRAADREAERKRREDEERDRRTQLAFDEAIEKERSRAGQAEAAPRNTISNTGGAGTAYFADDVPSYSSYDPKTGERKGVNTHYCSECGNLCKRGDKFCSRCGFKQPTDDMEQTQGGELRRNAL